MRMRNVPKFRKVPKGLRRGEPLRHPDHPRPTTRREFIAQGFMAGGASVVLPSLAGLLANPKIAHAQLAGDIAAAVTTCGITQGAGMIPFICFDLSGGANIMGSNVLGGMQGGQLDFISVAGYSKLGLPGSMIPNSSTTNNIDSSLTLRYQKDSAQLRGIKTTFTNTAAMANVTGTLIPALSQNDTNTNPHNPMYGIWQAGAQGALLNLIGTDSSASGGNSMAPPNMINVAATAERDRQRPRYGGSGEHGSVEHIAAQCERRHQRARVDETHQRREIQRVSSTPTRVRRRSRMPRPSRPAPTPRRRTCSMRTRTPVRSIRTTTRLSCGSSGSIFTTAEYQGSNDFQMTAAVMKLVIDGDAAAGTIQLGGYDYHTGERATGESRDFDAGQCIGAVLQYAAAKKKPVMIYIFSDGSLASDGTIDNSVGGRGKGVWTADNQNVAATYWLIYNPAGRAVTAQSNIEASLQLGYLNSDGSQNTNSSPAGNNVPNLVQMVVLNYLALHSANDLARWPNAVAGTGPDGSEHRQHARQRFRPRSAGHVPAARGTHERQSRGLIPARSGPAAWPGRTTRSPTVSAGRRVIVSPVDIERALERAPRAAAVAIHAHDVRAQRS